MIAACEWIFASDDLPAVLARLRAAGLDGIEIAGEPGRTGVAGALADAGLVATGITASCMAPTDERDLSHPAADARARAVGYYRGCVDVAVEAGAPAIGLIPAAVGRVDGDPAASWAWAVEGAREVAEYASQAGVRVAVEALNRYESFLVNRADQALAFAEEIGGDVILDAFHMQLEEADSVRAVTGAAPRMAALHLADSNRRGLGRGQLDPLAVVRAARAAGYGGPLVLEFTAPGPNPFEANKGEAAMSELDAYLRESVEVLRCA